MVDPTSPPPAASSAQNGSVEKISSSSSSANPDSRETYLSLLPHEQIIEICLLFEPHVPLHVKATVWPADLEAAILELKKKTAALAQPQPQSQPDPAIVPTPATNGAHVGLFAHQVHPPGRYASPPPLDEVPPMGSLRNPAEEAREREKASAAAAASTSTATLPSTSHPPTNNGDSSTRQATPGSHAATSLPQGQPATLHPPAPYPYGPYGYPMPPPPQGQQGAYPHTPYYSQPGYSSHYPYPHYPPGYPAPPPGPTPPPPHAHGSQPLFNSSPLVRPPIHPSTAVPQPPPPPPSGEDLPSYEEMIVEALLDCGESEGAAPKDLFTWMASRYPLQTNFRPSASQALQKAYKRGRLEKRAGGKYRLNASWEGGATSKRTTRRPQTLAQTTYAMQHPPPPTSSPFTHAPLQHSRQSPAPAQQPYNGYPYQYPYGHYPGYPPPDQPGQPSQDKHSTPVHPEGAAAAAAKESEDRDDGGDSGDPWEAAQYILKAINFGRLAQNSNNASASASPSADAPDADDFGAMLSAIAAAAASARAEPPRTTLTDDEGASLQAQLALLAAQLTEIADAEEEDGDGPALLSFASTAAPVPPPAQAQPAPQLPPPPAPSTHHQSLPRPQPRDHVPPHPPQQQPVPPKPVELPPPPIAAYSGAHLMLDVNAFPEVFLPPPPGTASGVQTEVDGEGSDDDDDDDDMEDVVVPPMPAAAGQTPLRT